MDKHTHKGRIQNKCIHITIINDGDGSNYELKRIIKKTQKQNLRTLQLYWLIKYYIKDIFKNSIPNMFGFDLVERNLERNILFQSPLPPNKAEWLRSSSSGTNQ